MRKFAWVWAIPLLLLITGLGARGLNADAYWLDEVWSLYTAGANQYGPLSPVEVWTRIATDDPQVGPLFSALLNPWGALVGWTPFAARALSLLCGVLAAAWLYRLGRDVAAPLAGFSAATFMGTSVLYVYYLHELRTYMLSVLLLTIVLWAYWRLLQRDKPSRFLQAGFVLSISGLLYTHYSIALALGVIGLYHLLFVPKNRRWWRITGLMALGGALFLPWMGVILEAFRRFGAANILTHDPGLTISELLARAGLFFSNGAWGLLALIGLLAVWSVRVYGRKSLAVWFWTLATLIVVVVVNERTGLIKFGRERYLLVLWPLLALLGGLGLASLGKTRLKLAAPLLLGVWLVIGVHANLDGTLMRDTDSAQTLPWDTLAATLTQQAQAGDVVALHDTAYNWVLDLRPAEYYLYGLPVRFTMLEALPGDTLTAAAREFVGDAPQVWVGIDKRLPTTSRLTDFTAALAGQYATCGPVFDLPRLRLDLYRRFPASVFQPEGANWHFGDDIAITDVSLTPPENGQPLKVQFVWAVSADVPPYTYSVGLHLLDDAGQLVGQADYGLPSEAFACRQTDIPAADLPSGDYQLRVMVYNWSTGERLSGRVTTTGETGERLLLETFTKND